MAEIREEDRQAARETLVTIWCNNSKAEVTAELEKLITRVRADVFTAGQVVGLNMAVGQVTGFPEYEFLLNNIRNRIRQLSPDPDYIERVKREVWEQAIKIAKDKTWWGDKDNPEYVHGVVEALELAGALRSQTTK